VVHGDREGLVRLGGDRAVAHRSGREPLDDLGERLDLVDRHRWAVADEFEQPTQRHQLLGLVVDLGGVLLEDVVALRPCGVLQLEHRLGVEQVEFALSAPLVLTTEFELAVGTLFGTGRIRHRVAGRDLSGNLVEADAAELGDRAGEVGVDHGLAEADRFEDLGAGVGRNRRHAHLGHDLEHTLATGLDVVLDGLLGVHPAEAVHLLADEVLDRLERQVRVDRSGPVADQQRHVVHFASVAGLDDQSRHRALFRAHEVMMHRCGEQQRRDRRLDGVGVAIGEHDDAGSGIDRFGSLLADAVERRAQSRSAGTDTEQARQNLGLEARPCAVVVDVDDLGEFVVVDDRERQRQLTTALRTWGEQVALGSDRRRHRRDDLFADRVQRRIRHLREELLEVVEQQSWSLRQHGERGCRCPSNPRPLPQ
jgi:hypothetical protein